MTQEISLVYIREPVDYQMILEVKSWVTCGRGGIIKVNPVREDKFGSVMYIPCENILAITKDTRNIKSCPACGCTGYSTGIRGPDQKFFIQCEDCDTIQKGNEWEEVVEKWNKREDEDEGISQDQHDV